MQQACSRGGVLKMGQRRVCRLFPLSGAWLREACLRCWNATYSWRSLFETVLMALGFCSVVCVRGNAVFARSLRACRGEIFRHSSVGGKCSWNLLGFCDRGIGLPLDHGAGVIPQVSRLFHAALSLPAFLPSERRLWLFLLLCFGFTRCLGNEAIPPRRDQCYTACVKPFLPGTLKIFASVPIGNSS
ncbi:hypothetical protein NPIL_628591 [Nephila pilipes]|uniref:Uncharacterized protein n=1 Tax=Nephila pilipes TaxID=299642 RepID=A0A8X6Q3K2_NEPPI|nr:hypothetical protein NPIL_628591 [Nephila pilipes]